MWLTGDDTPERVAAAVRRLKAVNHNPSVLSADEIETRFPSLQVQLDNHDDETESGAHRRRPLDRQAKVFLCEEDNGYFDPTGALRDLARVCREHGNIDLRLRAPVARITTGADGAATGVALADGTHISSAAVVNTAGPWCEPLNRSAGLKLPWTISPVRIQVIHKSVPGLGTAGGGVFANVPTVCDIEQGIYFRPQIASAQLVVSTVRHEEEQEVVPPDDFNRAVDPEMRQQYLNAIHARMPQLPARGSVSQYSALYTANFEDGHPLVGATPVKNLYIGNGFSGHGFKISPAVGSLLAQVITGGVLDDYETTGDKGYLSPTRMVIGPNRGVLG